ncbi:MAG: adenosylcobalamin-dependent ribonucleoside-diphosphate reductase [Pseudomonadaceae bacterium]|nr:adenosylcobalamin-dependent ribonucleoside-diphosphate reductase [Pseudomonadaceae bacterium]
MKVIKRNGEIVPFESEKIYHAITKAMSETELGVDLFMAGKIAEEIYHISKGRVEPLNIEEVQDLVENSLMDKKRFDVAKRYIIYRSERNKERNKMWEMTELQKDIYEKKYRFENESFGEFLDRVSGGNLYIRKLIQQKKFSPAGRILAHRGLNEKGKKVCYSNCFVNTPPKDNLESIFEVARDIARTYSMGGGVGFTLENLRPRGSSVNNSANETTGAVSFMDLYSLTTGLIGQSGRRGALMLALPIGHPDIEEFIDVKSDLDKVNFANISIMITDDFMRAVESDEDWKLHFQVESTGEIIEKTVSAKRLFRKIAENNWKMAEPGMLFWDRIQGYHLNSEVEYFVYSAVNPCAEKALVEDGSCLLASFNLSEYINHAFTDSATFDKESFEKDIFEVVRYMDDLLEEGIEYLPLEGHKQVARDYRQLGIGIMGIADMFIKMGIKYGDINSIIMMDDIVNLLINKSIQASSLLAKERGSYPKYSDKVLESKFLQSVAWDDTIEMVSRYGLRNSELLSIAPNGSISTMFGVSGGIEPIFALSHNRRSESLGDGEDVNYKVYSQIVRDYMEFAGITKESELPEYFVTSHDIEYQDRIKFQGIVQRNVDSAISSTVNLPNSATVEDVERIYTLAWKHNLKGITVYRDGCMREGILTIDKPKASDLELVEEDCNT